MTLKQRLTGNAAKIVLVVLLAVPALRSMTGSSQLEGENRKLAEFPAAPASWQETLKFPARLDQWINDHFGYRDRLLKLNNRVRHALFGTFPTVQVISGQNGRIFMSAHEANFPPYTAIHPTCGFQFHDHEKIAGQMNAMHAAFRGWGIDAKLVIAPSSPAVYQEELPGWLAQRCARSVPPFRNILVPERLSPPVLASVYYPIEELRAARAEGEVIPKTWFHLTGFGSRLLTQKSVERLWNIKADEGTTLKTRIETQTSDLAHLFPGVKLSSKVEAIDFAASGIEECKGAKCYPALQDALEKLGDVNRYRNERAPKERLIMLSDSFGQYSAGWYARYYRDVIHFSTNTLGRLSDGELASLRNFLREEGKRSDVLFFYHDTGVLTGRIDLDLKKLVSAQPMVSQAKN